MIERYRAARTSDEGFTLIELLIVIVVLGILSGIVVFGVSTFKGDATTTACQSTLKTVNVAADAYSAKSGAYPTTMTQLLPTATVAGYLKSDPAGTPALVATNGNYTFGASAVTSSACTLP